MPANSSEFPTESRDESAESRHHRTELFFGEAGCVRIRAARVTVVGLGLAYFFFRRRLAGSNRRAREPREDRESRRDPGEKTPDGPKPPTEDPAELRRQVLEGWER